VTGARSKLGFIYRGGLIALLVCACSGEDPAGRASTERESDELLVYTVNYPLAYFAERIAGSQAEVRFPAPADIDPADWSPTPGEVAQFQKADLILLNGGGYARWLERASLRRARLIDTSTSFRAQRIELRGGISHAHGPSGEHSHTGTAATTWLDPTLAIEHARAIAEALARARPSRAAAFRERLAVLEADLIELDEQLAAATAKLGGMPILFSHPVYQYLTRRYGLNAVSLHWEPNEMPDESQWRRLGELIDERPVRWMIWEDRPLDATVERLRSLGIESVVLETCANTPHDGDYLEAMQLSITASHRADNPRRPVISEMGLTAVAPESDQFGSCAKNTSIKFENGNRGDSGSVMLVARYRDSSCATAECWASARDGSRHSPLL